MKALARSRKNILSAVTLAVLVTIPVGLAACGNDAMQEYNDAGRLGNLDTDALVISFPDGFSNVAAKCVGTDLVYAAKNDNGRAIAVSPAHPWCKDGILTRAEVKG